MMRKLAAPLFVLTLSACATPEPTEVVTLGPNAPACPIAVPANASDEDVVRLVLAKRPDLVSEPKEAATLFTACGVTVKVQRVPLG
jgi:uncharacterized lipoprotein YmbA